MQYITSGVLFKQMAIVEREGEDRDIQKEREWEGEREKERGGREGEVWGELEALNQQIGEWNIILGAS